MKNWTCSKCGKKYETYPVILDSNELSIACELELREKYYDIEKKKGICKECRDKL